MRTEGNCKVPAYSEMYPVIQKLPTCSWFSGHMTASGIRLNVFCKVLTMSFKFCPCALMYLSKPSTLTSDILSSSCRMLGGNLLSGNFFGRTASLLCRSTFMSNVVETNCIMCIKFLPAIEYLERGMLKF